MRQHIDIIRHPAASSEVLLRSYNPLAFRWLSASARPKGQRIKPAKIELKKNKGK
jgi:hypothetical protein